MKYTFELKLDCVEKHKKHARIEIPPGVKSKKQEEFYLDKYLIALYQADDDDTLVAFVSNTKELAERLGRSQDSVSAFFAHHQKLFRFDSIPCKVHLIEA